MKIIFKESIAGPNYAYGPGDSAEFDQTKAIKFIKAGIAQPAKEKVIEKAEHLGGGWYRLPDGRKVQGKEKVAAVIEGLVE